MNRIGSSAALDEPLPTDVAAGAIGIGLWHEKYASFSWAWAWRRTLLFGAIAVSFGSLLGVIHGLYAHDFDEGLAVGWRATGANLLMVGLGPSLAAIVRHRRLAIAVEHALVVSGVSIGVMTAIVANELTQSFHDRLMGDEGIAFGSFAQLLAGELPGHGIVSFATNAAVTLCGFAIAGGALGLRAYFGKPRRWREHEARLAMGAVRRDKLEAERRLALLQAQVEPHRSAAVRGARAAAAQRLAGPRHRRGLRGRPECTRGAARECA